MKKFPFRVLSVKGGAALLFCAAVIAAWGAQWLRTVWLYIPMMGALLVLFGVVRREDGRWLLGLLRRGHVRRPGRVGSFSESPAG